MCRLCGRRVLVSAAGIPFDLAERFTRASRFVYTQFIYSAPRARKGLTVSSERVDNRLVRGRAIVKMCRSCTRRVSHRGLIEIVGFDMEIARSSDEHASRIIEEKPKC